MRHLRLHRSAPVIYPLIAVVLFTMVRADLAGAQTKPPTPAKPAATAAPATPSTKPDGEPAQALLTAPELEAMLAPIALYPDSLLTQMMMASTYPLEIVQADRWVKANK